jgi:hypothetical protein
LKYPSRGEDRRKRGGRGGLKKAGEGVQDGRWAVNKGGRYSNQHALLYAPLSAKVSAGNFRILSGASNYVCMYVCTYIYTVPRHDDKVHHEVLHAGLSLHVQLQVWASTQGRQPVSFVIVYIPLRGERTLNENKSINQSATGIGVHT